MKKATLERQLTLATVGIITALPEEYAATYRVFGCDQEVEFPGRGAGRKYAVATLTTKPGAKQVVAVALLTEMGNNSAAIRATQMAQHCPRIEHFVMVGIAGAVPNPQKAKDHVRLGDIVVSDRNGIVQYDFDKEHPDITEYRHAPRPPSAALIEAVKSLEANRMLDDRPWETYIKSAMSKLGRDWRRPKASIDILQDEPAPAPVIPHPNDPQRVKGQPRVFHGPIASANKLLKNPAKRNTLRDTFGVKAIEMEGSGVADATWDQERGYLVVRGTCDYCNPTKGDDWHQYAALAAAAYARCVIEALTPTNASTPALQKSNVFKKKAKGKKKLDIKREREIEQLKRVFYWMNPVVIDEFINQVLAQRLTNIGSDFFDGFKALMESSGFHLYDPKLKKLVRTLYNRWSNCFRYSFLMDASNNGKEAYFDMPWDTPRSAQQAEAAEYLPRTAQPLSDALRRFQQYVREEYLEIDVSKAGQKALSEYHKEEERLKRLFKQ